MADTPETSSTAEVTDAAETAETADAVETTDAVEGAEGEQVETTDAGENTDELPQWARNKIADLNRESASWRTQLRELEKKAEALKTPEDFQAALTEYQQKAAEEAAALRLEIDHRDICDTHKVPKELRSLVRGTKEEMEAAAKLLASSGAAFVDPAAGEPGGGIDPNQEGGASMSPDKLAKTVRRR